MESFPSFFFLLCKCGGHRPGAWPALSMSHVSMTSSGMKRGEQSGSRHQTLSRFSCESLAPQDYSETGLETDKKFTGKLGQNADDVTLNPRSGCFS